jgi:LacI family gluconate utilization system Gnt-I transcriptional repressor
MLRPKHSAHRSGKADESARRLRPGLGRVRLSDVAVAAGVSPVTVSRVLRRPELVAEATLAAVRAAIERLGYFPDLIAGSLASRQTGQVAIVVPSLVTPAFMTTIQGASDALRVAGYQMVLGDNNLSGESEFALIASLLGRRADGMILADIAQSKPARTLLAKSGVPVVETWTLTARPIDMNVGFDNRAAARAMTRHLIETGRRRVGMICGPLRQNERGRQRRLGFLDAVRAADLAADLFVELPFPSRLADCGAALASLVARAPDLDGVFCSGDTFAAGALLGAERRGWPVPERIAIAGLGDVELADCLIPRISTARVAGYRMGQLAAQMIIDRLQGRRVAQRIVDVGFEILRRESTAPVTAAV